jgi:hypothetical protein
MDFECKRLGAGFSPSRSSLSRAPVKQRRKDSIKQREPGNQVGSNVRRGADEVLELSARQ